MHAGLCVQQAQISVSLPVCCSEMVLSQLERKSNRRKYNLNTEVQCSCVKHCGTTLSTDKEIS